MKREEIVKIGNDLLNQHGDFSLWINLIKEFVDYKDSTKTDIILRAFPQLPQPVQVNMVKVALEHFGKELGVCTLNIEDSNTSFIINGVPQKQMRTLYYF